MPGKGFTEKVTQTGRHRQAMRVEPLTVSELSRQILARDQLTADSHVLVRIGSYGGTLHTARAVIVDCTSVPVIVIECDPVGISQEARKSGWTPGRSWQP